MLTPREIIRDYLSFLNVLHDNKNARFSELLKNARFSSSDDSDDDGDEGDSVPSEGGGKVSLFDIDI